MKFQYKHLQEPLKIAINKLLENTINKPQIQQHHKRLAEIKHYDKRQKKYLLESRNMPLQHENNSDESDSDADQNYKNLNDMQMKYLIRKKLLTQNLCSSILPEIKLYNPDEQKQLTDQQLDSVTDINEGPQEISDGQKQQNEANAVFEEDMRKHRNLNALKFIIQQLERYQAEKVKQGK